MSGLDTWFHSNHDGISDELEELTSNSESEFEKEELEFHLYSQIHYGVQTSVETLDQEPCDDESLEQKVDDQKKEQESFIEWFSEVQI